MGEHYYYYFGVNIITTINNLENKRSLSENLDGKRHESKKARSEVIYCRIK